MKEQVEALLRGLAESGCAGARPRMAALLDVLDKAIDPTLTRQVLGELRAWKCFPLMHSFATKAATFAQGDLLVHVKRQLAQAKIERQELPEAAAILEGLAATLPADGSDQARQERSEVNGLLGRTRKQLFVQAVDEGGSGQDELRASVEAYARVYELDPAWHGANLVALVARAERDHLALPGIASAQTWARRLIADLEKKPRAGWSAWDYASAGEAYLGLGNAQEAAGSFARYWNGRDVDAFALAGTERNLREIWQITEDSDDWRESLLTHIEARKLTTRGGSAKYSPGGLLSLSTRLQALSNNPEASFGAGNTIPLDRVLRLVERARSICRIVDIHNPRRAGTGFLVKGGDLFPPANGVFLLTNHHVLHGPELTDALQASTDYAGSIDVSQAQAEFHFWDRRTDAPKTIRLGEVVRFSARPSPGADFALATLAEAVDPSLALTLSRQPKPLGSRNVVDPRQRAKVFIVGHPEAGELSFSLSDNEVVDHELDDEPRALPRRIHYRTPTEHGSSGSPVFHYESLEVVGLHRTGRAAPLRDPWPGRKDGENYEANEAVAMRSLLGL